MRRKLKKTNKWRVALTSFVRILRNYRARVFIVGSIAAGIVCIIAYSVSCLSSEPTKDVVYHEDVVLRGNCGNTLDNLAVFTSEIGTREGPTTICAWPDSSIWIADSYNHLMKRFGPSGRNLQSFPLDPTSIVDDMDCDHSGMIVFRDWSNRIYMPLCDSVGRVVRKLYLPTGRSSGGSSSKVTIVDSSVFVQYMDSTAHYVGLHYNVNGTLVGVRQTNLRLWVETGGKFFVPADSGGPTDDVGPFRLEEIKRSDGVSLVGSAAPSGVWVHGIGCDSSNSIYLLQRIITDDEERDRDFVIKLDSLGHQIARFEVQDVGDIADAHFPKVDEGGRVYVLSVSDDMNTWALYRYSPSQ